MIKIEFKEATEILQDKFWPIVKFVTAFDFDLLDQRGDFLLGIDMRNCWDFRRLSLVESISDYNIEKDPMLDRSHILTQLGITKEQDEANQIEYLKIK